jgi:hypothetical protein
MSNTILIKRSGTANAVPSSGNLSLGELAINYQDGNLFYKDSGGTVQTIASKQFVSVSGNITGANVNTGQLSLSGNVISAINTTSNITTTANVSGGFILGNGYFLTGVITSVANINLGNSNINDISLIEYRKNFAYVPQEVVLFGGSIYENILYGNPDATMEEVIEAATKANAINFINEFPEKFYEFIFKNIK